MPSVLVDVDSVFFFFFFFLSSFLFVSFRGSSFTSV